MHAAVLIESFRDRPPESLAVQPYPGARSVWDYFHALDASKRLEAADAGIEQITDILTNHIFGRHPFILDLPPAVLHRYQQARSIASQQTGGESLLTDKILGHFEAAAESMHSGYSRMVTATILSPDTTLPAPEPADGQLKQRVLLPPSIQRRSLAWNTWVQDKIKAGGIDELFSTHPQWHATKLAEGSLLPVGNLNIEIVEGLARARRIGARGQYTEGDWSLPVNGEMGSGLDLWFAMTHIVEKDLLRLSDEVGPDMYDGMQLTPQTYTKAYIPIVELIDLNPQLKIQGVLSDGTWAYSSELAQLFPDQHISRLHDIAGTIMELGTAAELGLPEQVNFATGDPRRRAAYAAGEYSVRVASRFIDRQGMVAVIGQFGLSNI